MPDLLLKFSWQRPDWQECISKYQSYSIQVIYSSYLVLLCLISCNDSWISSPCSHEVIPQNKRRDKKQSRAFKAWIWMNVQYPGHITPELKKKTIKIISPIILMPNNYKTSCKNLYNRKILYLNLTNLTNWEWHFKLSLIKTSIKICKLLPKLTYELLLRKQMNQFPKLDLILPLLQGTPPWA